MGVCNNTANEPRRCERCSTQQQKYRFGQRPRRGYGQAVELGHGPSSFTPCRCRSYAPARSRSCPRVEVLFLQITIEMQKFDLLFSATHIQNRRRQTQEDSADDRTSARGGICAPARTAESRASSGREACCCLVRCICAACSSAESARAAVPGHQASRNSRQCARPKRKARAPAIASPRGARGYAPAPVPL